MSELCQECEDSWCGEGYCPKCGAWDDCFYGICLDDPVWTRQKEIYQFARDMQGNPRLLAIPPNQGQDSNR